MSVHRLLPILALAAAVPAGAVLAQQERAQTAQPEVRETVYDYALRHPVPEASLGIAPALGESIPLSVTLTRPENSEFYAYFYYAGQPVIVDMKTRSVVRIGE